MNRNIDCGYVEPVYSVCGTPIFEIVDDEMADTDYPNYRQVGLELCDRCKEEKGSGGILYEDYPCSRYYIVASVRSEPHWPQGEYENDPGRVSGAGPEIT